MTWVAAAVFCGGCARQDYRAQIEAAQPHKIEEAQQKPVSKQVSVPVGASSAEKRSDDAKAKSAKLPLQAVLRGVETTLTDPKTGATIAVLQAKTTTIGDAAGAQVGTLRDGTATLYKNNKPTTTVRADALLADNRSEVLDARGNVFAQSSESGTKERALRAGNRTLRADAMRYDAKQKVLTGSGNVVLTQDGDTTIYGDSFVADLELKKVSLRRPHGDIGILL